MAPFFKNEEKELMSKKTETPAVVDDFDYETMPMNSMEDYDKYNKWARKNGRHVKVPDENAPFIKKVRIKFQRFDQPENVLKTRKRCREIDWKGQLKPSKTYDLPLPIVRFLNNLSVPLYEEKPVEPGSRKTETVQCGEKPRFSCQVLDFI